MDAICEATGILVVGDVRIIGADGFNLRASTVKGNVVVQAAAVRLQGNAFEGKVSVKRFPALGIMGAVLQDNIVDGGGNLVINDGPGSCDPATNDTGAYIAGISVLEGNLKAECLRTVIAVGNAVVNGDLICQANLNLNQSTNVVFGGKGDCSKDLPPLPGAEQ